MELNVNGIVVHVQKKSIKNLYLRVKSPDGAVHATAPLAMTDAQIEAFVLQKAEWIRAQRERLRARAIQENEDTFVLFGRSYPIITSVGARKSFGVVTEDRLRLFLRMDCTREQRVALLRSLRRKELQREIETLLPVWEEKTGLHPASWHIKDMKTRWGSCNTRERRLWFSLRLADQPLSSLEYVVLHELAHLQVPNHGKDFAALLDAHMPDWRDRRRQLNGN